MTIRQYFAAPLAAVVAVAAIGAAEKWESKPFNTWTDVELKQVTTSSPWAGKGSISYAQSRGGESQPIEDQTMVTWMSALPQREASIREQIKEGAPIPDGAEAYLAREEAMYVIAVRVTGGSGSGSYGSNIAAMAKETFLLRDGKKPLAVARAEGARLDKDGKEIETPAPGAGGMRRGGGPGGPGAGAPAQPEAPPANVPAFSVVRDATLFGSASRLEAADQRGGGPPGGGGAGLGGGRGAGATSSLLIYGFSKTDPITTDDKEVEFVTKLCGGGMGGMGMGRGGGGGAAAPASNCSYNVKRKFKVKDMMYKGKLAL